jgi:hypothetical protein
MVLFYFENQIAQLILMAKYLQRLEKFPKSSLNFLSSARFHKHFTPVTYSRNHRTYKFATTAFSIMTLSIILGVSIECHYAVSLCWVSHFLIVMLNVVKHSVVMLSVVAPLYWLQHLTLQSNVRRFDIQHNDITHNDNRYNGLNCESQHKR